jgi:hypothetical protein
LTYLSSSPLVEHKARHRSLHFGRSRAASSASLQVDIPISDLSLSVVLLQVSFGLPCFLFLSGAHVSAIFVLLLLSFLRMCPIYRHLLVFNSSSIVLDFVHSLRFSLVMLFGQNIRRILLRYLLWNDSHFLMSYFVALQHSEPYNSTGMALLLYILSLVLLL